MNITFKWNNSCPYKDTSVGDIFTQGNHVYMVTDQQINETTDELKAVNLANGEMVIFGSNEMVNRVEDAELILNKPLSDNS